MKSVVSPSVRCSALATRPCKPRAAFALVAVLVLMAFLLVLVLSMAAFLRAERTTAMLQMKQAAARQNALLGMRTAVSELQKNLGSDTRVSARAQILEDAAGASMEQPFWTGVWKPVRDEAEPEEIDPRKKPEHLTWLVSGNSGTTVKFRPDSAESGNTSRLVPLASFRVPVSGQQESHTVKVPVVDVSNGAFAYWVSDEGVKAKLNAVAENYQDQTQPLLPLVPGIKAFPDLASVPDEPLKWKSLFEISQVQSDPEVLRRLYPDITLHGHGVLADSLRGGLRYDLSSLTNMSSSEFSSKFLPLMPSVRMFGPYIPVGGNQSQGPSWDVLRQFAELKNLQTANGHTVRPTTGTAVGIFPIVERFQIYVVLRLSGNLAPPGMAEYRPRVYLLPAVVLWNPYNRPLVAPDGYRFRVERSSGQTNAWKYQYAAGFYNGTAWEKFPTESGSDTGEFTDILQANDGLRFQIRGKDGGAVVIPPGEGRVFTLTTNSPISSSTPFVLEPGVRDFGLYQDALQTFRVNEASLGGREIYLDLRHRGWQVNNAGSVYGPGDIYLNLENAAGLQMQRIGILRFLDQLSARPTVSELASHSFGTDLNGPQPVLVAPGGIPADGVPAYSPASEDVVMGYEIGLKTPEAKMHNSTVWRNPGERMLARLNPRAPVNTLDQTSRDGYDNNQPPGYGAAVLFSNTNIDHFANENYLIDTWDAAGTATCVGFGDELDALERAGYFDLPDSDWAPRSLGDFRHLDLAGSDTGTGGTPRNLAPAFIIGEARADPFVSRRTNSSQPLSEYLTPWKIDYQWLANRALWDRFFVSTVPASGPLTFPLPNGLMVPFGLASAQPDAAESARLRNFRTAAENLLVDGAFNVNSTSVMAWEALFSRFLGQSVNISGGAVEANSNAAPFLGSSMPLSGAHASGDTSSPRLYTGYRKLDAGAIKALAEEVVKEIKRRGPFTSLADFVNRSINPDDRVFNDPRERGLSVADSKYAPLKENSFTLGDLAQEPRLFGTLQAAIEKAGLNDFFDDEYFARSISSHPDRPGGLAPWQYGSTENTAAAYGAFMEGAPGYLTQGAMLARLGPVLSARSDIFTVRSYGEVQNPKTGAVEAKAWCEAVVQRLPEYVDEGDAPDTRPADLKSRANREFGRRFVVVNFRWLKEDQL